MMQYLGKVAMRESLRALEMKCARGVNQYHKVWSACRYVGRVDFAYVNEWHSVNSLRSTFLSDGRLCNDPYQPTGIR